MGTGSSPEASADLPIFPAGHLAQPVGPAAKRGTSILVNWAASVIASVAKQSHGCTEIASGVALAMTLNRPVQALFSPKYDLSSSGDHLLVSGCVGTIASFAAHVKTGQTRRRDKPETWLVGPASRAALPWLLAAERSTVRQIRARRASPEIDLAAERESHRRRAGPLEHRLAHVQD